MLSRRSGDTALFGQIVNHAPLTQYTPFSVSFRGQTSLLLLSLLPSRRPFYFSNVCPRMVSVHG